MPIGSYRVLSPDGRRAGTEELRSAPGPMGWRCFARRFTGDGFPAGHADLTVDSAWRLVRVRLASAHHEIVLAARGQTLQGQRDGTEVTLPWDGSRLVVSRSSPCFLPAVLPRVEGAADHEVLALDPETCEPRAERHHIEPGPEEEIDVPPGRFRASRWTITDPEGTRRVWIAGALLVCDEGRFELETYEAGAHGPAPLPGQR